MKLCKLEELKGNEKVARAVYTKDFTILLNEGTKLKPEYVEKLREMEIKEIYIEEEKQYDSEEIHILTDDIEKKYKRKVRSILERHTYHQNKDLVELCNTAENIISNIIEEKEVVEKIYDIRERSADIYEHCLSVCTLSTLVALKLGLNQQEIKDIGAGALLHELGLRYLTIRYENTPLEELDSVEAAEYKKHPVYGYTALKNKTWISDVSKNIILYHHEKLNGYGYPLKAKELPLEAKIVNCCDTFDEMICGIGCKRTKVYEAVEYLKNFKNVLFDGKIVDVFLEFTAVYPVGTVVRTNEGEEAVVIRQNAHFQDRPVVRIVKDKDGNTLSQEIIKDLLQEQSLFIEEVKQ